MAVHAELSDWYRRAEIEPSAEQLEYRMAGINSVLNETRPAEYWLDVVRLAAGDSVSTAEHKSSFHSCFQEHDAAFGESFVHRSASARDDG